MEQSRIIDTLETYHPTIDQRHDSEPMHEVQYLGRQRVPYRCSDLRMCEAEYSPWYVGRAEAHMSVESKEGIRMII